MSKLTTSDLVLRDPITGVHARAALPSRLQTDIHEARMGKQSLSIILAHINFPKGKNPVPELIRNSALSTFVARVRATVHGVDNLFRLGGSDFALILRGEAGDGAAQIGRKLLKAAHEAPLEEGHFTLSMSMGLASFPADAQNYEELLAIARRRMREAQVQGQGRLITHDEGGSGEAPRATKLLTPLQPPVRKPSPEPLRIGPILPLTLPTHLSNLVGRDREQADLHALLDEARLVTVLGPEGIGKTSLAAQVMSERAMKHTHGSCLISLENAHECDHITSAIGMALGFTFSNSEVPSDQLVGYLRDKDILLVLDSISPLSVELNLLRDLIDGAPHVQILTTAVEPLGLGAERIFTLTGLSTEESSEAHHLFVNAARQSDPDFTTGPSDLKCIGSICSLLSGTPLALTIAGGAVPHFGCEKIASEIKHSILAAANNSQAQKQISDAGLYSALSAETLIVMDTIWSLLPDIKRDALARLSVFEGGFSERAAVRAASVAPPQLAELRGMLLINKAENGRYNFHPSIKRYAAAKLHSTPERESNAFQRHAAYYLKTLRDIEPQLAYAGGQTLEARLGDIEKEIENLRAAWRWAIKSEDEDGIGEALESLLIFYEARGLFEEGERELGLAAASLRRSKESRGEVLGRSLTRQARMSTYLGRYDQAGNLLQEALVYLGGLHAPEETARALRALGEVAYLQGKYDEALEFVEEARLVRDEEEEVSSIWTTSPTLNIRDLISSP